MLAVGHANKLRFVANLLDQPASSGCLLCFSLSKNGEVAVLVADGTQLVQEVHLNSLCFRCINLCDVSLC